MTTRDRLNALRSRQGSLRSDSTITLAFHVVGTLCYGAGSVLIARAIGPREAGLLALFLTGTSVLGVLSDFLGVSYANAYFVAAEEAAAKIAESFASVMLYGSAIGLVTAVLFAWSPLFDALFRGLGEDRWRLWVGLDILGLCITTQVRNLLLGRRRFIVLGAVNTLTSLIFATLSLLFIYGMDRQYAEVAAEAHVLSTWVGLAIALAYLSRRGIGRPSLRYLQQCIRLGWRGSGTYWISYLHLRADQLIVNRVLGPVAVGLYSTAVSLGELITQVPSVLGLVLFSHVAADSEGDGQARARSTFRRTFITMGLISLVGCAVAVAAPLIVRTLYGEEFRDSARLLRYLVPAIVAVSGVYVANGYVSGLGYPPYQVVVALLSMAVNLGMNALLLERIGIIGAPIASSMSYSIWLVLILLYVRRKKASTEVGVADLVK